MGDTIYLFAGSHEEMQGYINNIKSAETINDIKSVLSEIIERDGYYKSEFGSSIAKENDRARVESLFLSSIGKEEVKEKWKNTKNHE